MNVVHLLLVLKFTIGGEADLTRPTFGGVLNDLAFGNPNQYTKRLIYRCIIWEGLCNIGLQPNDLRFRCFAFWAPRYNPHCAEVIFGAKVIFKFFFRFLLHSSYAHFALPRAR